ncbi:MAG: T9SS type A sorting domain-containing protein [Lewinellaceae bacterium]|nr:T9SS type A sorting domain-containing protein [Lewinellaceae bacterium]
MDFEGLDIRQLMVSDVLGKPILQYQIMANQPSIVVSANLKPGLYFVVLQQKNGAVTSSRFMRL